MGRWRALETCDFSRDEALITLPSGRAVVDMYVDGRNVEHTQFEVAVLVMCTDPMYSLDLVTACTTEPLLKGHRNLNHIRATIRRLVEGGKIHRYECSHSAS